MRNIHDTDWGWDGMVDEEKDGAPKQVVGERWWGGDSSNSTRCASRYNTYQRKR